MPWKASSVMEERLLFVARLLDGETMTDVCREFGISRKTGYKIFDRYREQGQEALSDRSRRPMAPVVALLSLCYVSNATLTAHRIIDADSVLKQTLWVCVSEMRITTVISDLTGGGAQRVCVNLANAWAARGRRVTILTVTQNTMAPAYSIDPRVEHHNLGWPRDAHSCEPNVNSIAPVLRGLLQAGCPEMVEQLPFIAMLRHAILATAPDVVVAHIDRTNVRVLAAMHETGIPVIACEHTDTSQVSIGQWQHAREALYRRARAVVATHSTIADWLRRRGAVAYAIPNPLLAPPQVSIERNGHRHRLVTLARLSPEKRIDLLIQAFAKIASNFPEWDFEIYGIGPLGSRLARLVDELAPGRVHLCGFTTDPYAILRGADLFASASWVEGFGNAIWEALACGVPVVAMDCGAPVRSLVRNGVDGILVRTRGELVQALRSLMGDEGARKALAARALEVLTRFPVEASLQAWDALFDDVTLNP